MSEGLTQRQLDFIRDCKQFIDTQLTQAPVRSSFSLYILGSPSQGLSANKVSDIFSGYLNKWCDENGYGRYRSPTIYPEEKLIIYNFNLLGKRHGDCRSSRGFVSVFGEG